MLRGNARPIAMLKNNYKPTTQENNDRLVQQLREQ